MLLFETLTARLEALGQSRSLDVRAFGEVIHGGVAYPLSEVSVGPLDAPTVYVAAGVHGDEASGVEAALQVLETIAEGQPSPTAFQLRVFPCLNPSGLAAGTRTNGSGQDINRQFHADLTPETAAVRRVTALSRAHALVDLHADGQAHGFYLFELLQKDLSPFAPRFQAKIRGQGYALEPAPQYAGYVGQDGVIAPSVIEMKAFIGRAPGASFVQWGWEAGVPRGYVFEAPQSAPFPERVAMHRTALAALFAALEPIKEG